MGRMQGAYLEAAKELDIPGAAGVHDSDAAAAVHDKVVGQETRRGPSPLPHWRVGGHINCIVTERCARGIPGGQPGA